MRILNLFAGIGGNRTAWNDAHAITAVEKDPDILDCALKPTQYSLEAFF